MNAFYQATKELNIADRVTLFTASDFGRKFQSNGSGADHAWGSHAFILGDPVKGGSNLRRLPDNCLEWTRRRRGRSMGAKHGS
jgi:uncharacterized protein (DUF1501 family)